MRDLPRPGQVYRHFKGNIYRIITIADHSETGETLVVYKRDDEGGKSYARPLDMFMSEVDRKKYPDAKEKYRFTLVTDDTSSEALPNEQADGGLDPLLEAFLDASDSTERLERFYDLKKVADDTMLGYVATSLGIEVSGDKDEKCSEILSVLRAREKYESNRLRR